MATWDDKIVVKNQIIYNDWFNAGLTLTDKQLRTINMLEYKDELYKIDSVKLFSNTTYDYTPRIDSIDGGEADFTLYCNWKGDRIVPYPAGGVQL